SRLGGRPSGRTVCSSFSSLAVRLTQSSSPLCRPLSRLEDRPFALLEINSDSARVALGRARLAHDHRPGREGGDPLQVPPSLYSEAAGRCGRYPLECHGALTPRPTGTTGY